jgi:1-acyl-sn-glycerol-3-phosphate acyltransferase
MNDEPEEHAPMAEHSAKQARALAVSTSLPGKLSRRLVWRLIRAVIYPYFRASRTGAHHLDTPGPLILAPVHRSNLDSLLVAGLSKRMMYALSKESLFSPAPLGWVIASLGGFPVNRGAADRKALKSAQLLLEQGLPIIVFPEGTRQTGGQLGEIFDGAAFLSARTGAKVVPIGIAGTEDAMPPGARFPRRTRVALVAGEPLDAPVSETGRVSLTQRRAFTARLAESLQLAFDQAEASRAP